MSEQSLTQGGSSERAGRLQPTGNGGPENDCCGEPGHTGRRQNPAYRPASIFSPGRPCYAGLPAYFAISASNWSS